MRIRKLLLPSAVALAIALTVLSFGPAQADSNTITFEPPKYAPGSIHNQDGWSSSGPYDHKVVAGHPAAPASFGAQSLRLSNAVTSGSFGDQTFSRSLVNEAGEAGATNGGMSGGVRQNFFEAEWQFASTVPGAEQPGLSVVASPDRGDGARMSWVQITDTPGGLQVNFQDYRDAAPFGSLGNVADGCGAGDAFVLTPVAVALDRTVPHTVKVTMTFVPGPRNDVVRVFVDGVLQHTGTTWEDYFRWCEGPGGPFPNSPVNESRTVDSILFRTGGAAAPATFGNGFLVDNLKLNSGDDADADGDADSNTVVVSPANMNGWVFAPEGPVGSVSSGGFEQGPGTPPLGSGSAFMTVDATGRHVLARPAFANTRFDQISELRYSTYQNNNANGVVAISLQFAVDYNLTDANTAFQGRLVFEPYQIPSNIQQNVWQTWHPMAGRWWASNPAASGGNCPQALPCTWQQVLALFPNAGIHANPAHGGVIFRAGGPWAPGFDGNVDAFTIGVGTTFTTYDFEADRDGDGVIDDDDNCDDAANPGQEDLDNDGQGDACDADDDGDGVPDANDNCPAFSNSDQANNDGDGEGDACDADDDNDGVLDGTDNCQFAANADQANNDGDAQGDVCDADDDNDGVADATDNCDFVANPGQQDTDNDGLGDACDNDDDGDGVADANDACPGTPSGTVVNASGCPLAVNKDQCKNNGWMNLRRADNTTFKNQGDCIQYANTGK